jgi:peptidoglycan/xylan/chitin deacetylase (PgdA/CDA1 family)
LNVSEAIRYPAEPSVCITFDDGCETDLIAAAPVLRELAATQPSTSPLDS